MNFYTLFSVLVLHTYLLEQWLSRSSYFVPWGAFAMSGDIIVITRGEEDISL